MTNRKAIIGFAVTVYLLSLGIVFSIILQRNGMNLDILLKENGIIESASTIGYFICVIFVLRKGGIWYFQKYNYFIFIIIFFMLRELDFDKRFTSIGIFKVKFFISSTVSIYEKIAGVLVILLLIYCIFLFCIFT